MAMFNRKRRDPDRQVEAGVESGVTGPSRPNTVGGLLRTTREDYGWELTAVAKALRIRPEYLTALERNSVEGLPGPAYAVGFLRAYAEYLNLDSAEVLRRFKTEKAGLQQRQELSFPVPLTQRGIPGMGFFLTAVILIGLGYGAWYFYVTGGERAVPPSVEAPPRRLVDPSPPPSPDGAVAPEAATEPPPAATPGLTASPNPAPAPVLAPPAAAPAATAAPPSPRATAPLPTAVATGTPLTPVTGSGTAPLTPMTGATATSAAGVSTSGVPGSPAGNASGSAAPTAAVVTPPPTTGPATPTPAPTAAAGVTPPQPGPTPGTSAYGSAQTPGRMMVRAKSDCWVQVSENGKAVFIRVLHAGDVYYPPDRPGLVLRAGNIAALDVLLDGKVALNGGPSGQVRNVDLDPSALTAGTAIEGEPPPAH